MIEKSSLKLYSHPRINLKQLTVDLKVKLRMQQHMRQNVNYQIMWNEPMSMYLVTIKASAN